MALGIKVTAIAGRQNLGHQRDLTHRPSWGVGWKATA